MRIFICAFICVSLIFNTFIYELGILDVFLAVVSSILTISYFSRIRFVDKMSSLAILFYCYFSMSFLPFTHLVPPIWNTLDLTHIATFGNKIYFVVISTIWLTELFQKRTFRYKSFTNNSYHISDEQVRLFFIVTMSLSAISYVLGVSVMGAEATVLPFHLSGVLHNYRVIFAPLFFMLIIENKILNHQKIPSKWFALFIVWCLFESFLRISKSSLVYGMLPAVLFMLFYYKPPFKKVVLYLVPFMLVAVTVYSIIGGMRGVERATVDALVDSREEASKKEYSPEWGDPITGSFNRMFMTAWDYREDYGVFDESKMFDFSKAPLILVWKGTARYRTYMLHGKSESGFDSDGTTGIIDPLFWGGYGFCYLCLFLITVLAVIFENGSKGRLGLQIFCALIFWNLIQKGIISWILNQNLIIAYVVRIVAVYLIIRLNYNYKKKCQII